MQPNQWYDKLCDEFAFLLKLGNRDIEWRVMRSVDLMMRNRDEHVTGSTIIVEAHQSVYRCEVPVSSVLAEREIGEAVDFVVAHVRYAFSQLRQTRPATGQTNDTA